MTTESAASATEPEAPPTFYVEATLPLDARTYIKRLADDELFAALGDGHYCYVLDASQVGKSSLMLRVKQRLEASGVARTAHLDLQRVGAQGTPEQFYAGVLSVLVPQLTGGQSVWDVWRAARSDGLGATMRWLTALRSAALIADTPLVIFIDEVQLVRKHAVGDEFFASIRSTFTERLNDPAFRKLTFCLLGTSTPADLTRDARVSLLNIGRQIALTDFSPLEAAPLAEGLPGDAGQAQQLLERVLYWTDGHPYLTQRVCKAISERIEVRTPPDVDRLCRELFFGEAGAQSLADGLVSTVRGYRDWLVGAPPALPVTDPNLVWVKRNLLPDSGRSEDRTAPDRAGATADEPRKAALELLTLYRRALQSRLPHDERAPALDALRIAGVVKLRGRRLEVRNRIYQRVFSRIWVDQEIRDRLDDAAVREERRRHRLSRFALAGGIVGFLSLVSAGAVILQEQERRTAEARRNEDTARQRSAAALEIVDRARKDADAARRNALRADQELVDREAELQRVRKMLVRQADLQQRARMESTLIQMSGETWPEHELTSAGDILLRLNPTDRLRTAASYHFGRAVRRLSGATVRDEHRGAPLQALTATRDGRFLVSGDADGNLLLWEPRAGRVTPLQAVQPDSEIPAVAFSDDGNWLVTGGSGDRCFVWDLRSLPLKPPAQIDSGPVSVVALSQDGEWLATAAEHAPRKVSLRHLRGDGPALSASIEGTVQSLDFLAGPAPRLLGRVMLRGKEADILDSVAFVWAPRPGRTDLVEVVKTGLLVAAVPHPNGRQIVLLGTGSGSREVRWIEAATGRPIRRVTVQSTIFSGAFNRDGSRLYTGHHDGRVREWTGDALGALRQRTLPDNASNRSHLHHLTVSADGQWILGRGDDSPLRLWDLGAERMVDLPMTQGAQGRGAFAIGTNASAIALTATAEGIYMWDLKEVMTATPPTLLTIRGRTNGSARSDAEESLDSRTAATPARTQINVFVRMAMYDEAASSLAAFPYSEKDQAYPKVWSADGLRPERGWDVPHFGARDGVFDPTGQFLVTIGWKPLEAHVWNVRARQEVKLPAGELSRVMEATFFRTAQDTPPFLALAGFESEETSMKGRLAFWRLGAAPRRVAPTMTFDRGLTSVGVLRTNRGGAVLGALDGRGSLHIAAIELVDASTGATRTPSPGKPDVTTCHPAAGAIFDIDAGLKVAADRARTAAADNQGSLYVWETATLAAGDCRPLVRLPSRNGSRVRAFEPGAGGSVALSYFDGEVRLLVWEAGGLKDRLLPRPAHPITAWAFSPDGRYLVSAGSSNRATLWDVASGLELDSFAHADPDNEINSVAFHPRGLTLVTAADRGEVHVWPFHALAPGDSAPSTIRRVLARYTHGPRQADVTAQGPEPLNANLATATGLKSR